MPTAKRTASAAGLDSRKSNTERDQRNTGNPTPDPAATGQVANTDFHTRLQAALELLRQHADDANGSFTAMRAQLVEAASARSSTPALASDASTTSTDDSDSVHTANAAVATPLLNERGELDLQAQRPPVNAAVGGAGEFNDDKAIMRWQLDTDGPWSASMVNSGENASKRLAHLEAWLDDISAQFAPH